MDRTHLNWRSLLIFHRPPTGGGDLSEGLVFGDREKRFDDGRSYLHLIHHGHQRDAGVRGCADAK